MPRLMIARSRASLVGALLVTLLLMLLWHRHAAPTAAQGTPSCLAPPSDLVSWWPGDGSSVDFQDGNSGTLVNGAAFAPGKVGLGFSLDGIDDRVEIPDAANLKPANVTVDTWVKFDALDTPGASLPGLQYIVFKRNSRTSFFEGYALVKIRVGTVDRLRFVIASAAGVQAVASSTTAVAAGQFYHVAGSYDGATAKLYVNGVLEAQQAANFPLDYGPRPVFIGSSEEGHNGRLKGVVDEASIYNRALSAAEIQALFVASSAGKCKPDADGDSVIDALDACPGTPAGIVVDESGCPVISCPPLATGWNFSERFNGAFDNTWVAPPGALPNAFGFTYIGAPSYTFAPVQGRLTLRMTNTPNDRQRVGFVTDSVLPGSVGRLEARINTLTQDATRIDGLFELWLVNATDTSKWVRATLFGSHFSTQRRWDVESSLGNYFAAQVNYANDTWYRLRIDALPGSLRASLWNDAGTIQIASYTFTHQLAALGANFRIGIAQYMGTPNTPTVTEITDVAVDYVRALPTVVANAGPDQTVECQGAQTIVTLNGTSSCDPDSDALTFTWREGTTLLGTGPTLQVNLSRGIHAITLTVADPGGASAQDTVIINVVDTTRPTITGPPALTFTTGADATACGKLIDDATLGVATANDNCGAVMITRSGVPAGNFFPISTTTIIYTATDSGGNTATTSQTVTVSDNTLPTITAPAPITVVTGAGSTSCGVTISDATLGTATASDNCGSAPITRSGVPAGNLFPVGTTTITYTATDLVGNVATATQTITVTDNTPPIINAPAAVSISTGAGASACGTVISDATLGNAAASDNCGSGVTVNRSGVPAGNLFPVGVTTITYTATDASGNTATATQTITVTDNTAPSITAPPAVNINTDAGVCSATGVALGTPTTSDNCGVASVTNNASSSFPIGTTTVTWTVTDVNGNTATATQTITVTDNQKPSLNAPAPLNVTTGAGATSCGLVISDAALGAASASDNCGAANITRSGVPAGNVFPVGTTTITYTATDAAGNTQAATQTVTVVDNTVPVITSCPANISVAGNSLGSCSANVNPGVATATDNCPGVSVAGVRSDGQPLSAPYPAGVTTITWTAKDAANNTASCQQTVTVTNPAPVATITGPETGSVYAAGTTVNFVGSFADNLGGTHTATWTFEAITSAGTVNEAIGTITGSHTFTAAGVYAVKLTVNDGCGGTHTTETIGPDGLAMLVVVYDPSAGWVTGGGWINSPAGAYLPDQTLTGKANFGFVSKYQNGQSVPTGNTEFHFRAGNLKFQSTSYEWMVIAGARAQYRGVGKINGAGDYRFMLTAIDGQQPGGGGQDKFRIRIWDNNGGGLVYDNQMNAPDNVDPTTVLGGGSIVIHR